MEINKQAKMFKHIKIDENHEIAIASNGTTIEFKIKCLAKDLWKQKQK